MYLICPTAASGMCARRSTGCSCVAQRFAALCRHPRNLTDEQFAEIANRRGLVGINLYTPFLVRQSDSVIDDAIDHIERFIGMYGEKVVALGCDFDGCDTLPIGIDGLADMYRLADRMLTLGYKQETVDGLFYDNALYAENL